MKTALPQGPRHHSPPHHWPRRLRRTHGRRLLEAPRRPLRRWSILLWLTYALLALAAVLAMTGRSDSTFSVGDALVAAVVAAVLLVAVPYKWARSQTPSKHDAAALLGWSWTWRPAILGVACGILLFALAAPSLGANHHGAWPVALGYGAIAAATEELFFRGHLQKRFGAGQVVVFAVLHSNGGWVGVAFPLAAGLLFTILARHGLAAPMAAHGIFNALAALPP